jgi:hypothetical protein
MPPFYAITPFDIDAIIDFIIIISLIDAIIDIAISPHFFHFIIDTLLITPLFHYYAIDYYLFSCC